MRIIHYFKFTSEIPYIFDLIFLYKLSFKNIVGYSDTLSIRENILIALYSNSYYHALDVIVYTKLIKYLKRLIVSNKSSTKHIMKFSRSKLLE